jgi:hypothetical protein
MGRLTTCAYDVRDGQEYVAYMERVLEACEGLTREGRLPDTEEIARFIDVERASYVQLRRDVASALARNQSHVVSEIAMDEQDYTRMVAMNDTLVNLLTILEYRDALELNRTETIARVSDAIVGGTFTA